TPFLVMPIATSLFFKTSIYDSIFGFLNFVLSPFGVHHVSWTGSLFFAGVRRGARLGVDTVHDADRPRWTSERVPRGDRGRAGRWGERLPDVRLDHLPAPSSLHRARPPARLDLH